MWNLKKQKETHRHREQTSGCQRGEKGAGKDKNVKWIKNTNFQL